MHRPMISPSMARQASEVALDDLATTVSILSGIDVEELENEAGD
ncbi:hypothetical protein P7H12_10620 [Paenibacillus larvae]|nr:hypothetical protein [Paenibacillus larvae]MDT2263957.1 hypothetical protein [Paenibacillus larvae]